MATVSIYIQDTTTSEYNRVDLFDDEKISVTSSIQNINDIAKTYTDFSQTFTVPASKQNNKIFKHWYDNSNDIPFSTLVKSNAYIEIDTIPFRKGKIQLESANVVDGQAQDYSITFIGILGNLKDTFAGKYLKDLTLDTSYDFNYTADLVKDKVTTQTTTPAYPDIKFPLISSIRNWNYAKGGVDDISSSSYPIRYNELFPAIKLRSVLNMIETQFGINFDGTFEEPSNFLSDARFTNAYLYLKNAETFEAKQTLTKVNFTSESGDSSAFTGYTVNLTNDTVTNTTAITNYFSGSNLYIFTRKKIVFNITPSVSGISYSIKINKNGILIFDSGLLNSTSGVVYSKEIETTTNYIATNDYFEIYVGTSQVFTFTTNVSAISTYTSLSGGTPVTQTKTRNFLSASQTTPSYTLQINQYFPEIKIEDFFSGLLKMFNLTCYSNDGINYTVEQLESYYNAGSDIDITKYVLQDKKALNRVKTYKKINFEYEKSESFINVAFESNAGIPYGTLRYVNDPPTEGEEYSIKLPFEDLNFLNLKDLLQVGYFLKTDYQAYIPKPIILYDYNPSGLTTLTGTTFYISTALTGSASNTTVNAYKAFGQETLISGETYGLNFPSQQSTLTNEIVTNGLYQNYYSDYFNNIYNYKARLVKLSAILPTSILTTLKLNDSIIMRDAKYLINTYTTDLTTGLVQFELLTDERVREFQDQSLKLYLDAGNPLSYPGTGTLWTDLSGNNNNGTLVNGATFNSANGGSIVFDGLDDYSIVSNLPILSVMTVDIWIKIKTNVSNTYIFNKTPTSVNNNNYGLSIVNSTIRMSGFNATPSNSNIDSNYIITVDQWVNITAVYNSTSSAIYINGNLDKSGNINTVNSGSQLSIAYNLLVNSGALNCNISTFNLYNRALTATEVLAKFNATKGRYGL